MKTLVLGLGNTILRDDGAGIYVVRALADRLNGAADCRESECAGLELVEMLNGYDRAVIIDTIELEGEEPGTVFRLKPDDMRITARLASLHDVDLVTALALGRRLGFGMPDEVTVYAVQGADTRSLGEGCTEPVVRALPALVEEIAAELEGRCHPRVSRPLAERKRRDA
jgi:hydrogenase maturation protease